MGDVLDYERPVPAPRESRSRRAWRMFATIYLIGLASSTGYGIVASGNAEVFAIFAVIFLLLFPIAYRIVTGRSFLTRLPHDSRVEN